MASADFWRSFPTPRDAGSTWQTTRSPRVWRTHLPAYACRIYVAAFRARIGLCIYWPAYPAAPPLSASCSSGQRFAYSFLQIPPRDGHPCRSANTSPCRVCRGLSPPSECALPGAPRKRPPIAGWPQENQPQESAIAAWWWPRLAWWPRVCLPVCWPRHRWVWNQKEEAQLRTERYKRPRPPWLCPVPARS
jgi:hypothetical protein